MPDVVSAGARRRRGACLARHRVRPTQPWPAIDQGVLIHSANATAGRSAVEATPEMLHPAGGEIGGRARRKSGRLSCPLGCGPARGWV